MKNVIIPTPTNDDNINLSDLTTRNLIIAYNGDVALGFCIFNDSDWYLQTSADTYDIERSYETLNELVLDLQKQYKNFNLKVA